METLSEQQQPQEGHDEKHGDYVVRIFTMHLNCSVTIHVAYLLLRFRSKAAIRFPVWLQNST